MDLIKARVASADRPWEDRIVVAEGRAKPFAVERSWSGPAGNYREQWSIRRGMKDVVYEATARSISVWGMQSVSDFTDRVAPISLEPGSYRLVFTIEGRFMGSVEAIAVAGKEAAA